MRKYKYKIVEKADRTYKVVWDVSTCYGIINDTYSIDVETLEQAREEVEKSRRGPIVVESGEFAR